MVFWTRVTKSYSFRMLWWKPTMMKIVLKVLRTFSLEESYCASCVMFYYNSCWKWNRKCTKINQLFNLDFHASNIPQPKQELVVDRFCMFFVTNQRPCLQDRACEIRPVIRCWLLTHQSGTIEPFQLVFFTSIWRIHMKMSWWFRLVHTMRNNMHGGGHRRWPWERKKAC